MSQEPSSSKMEKPDSESQSDQSIAPSTVPQAGTKQPVCGPGAGLLIGLLMGGLMWGLLWQFEPSHPDRQPFSMPAEVAAKTEGYVVPPREIQIEIEVWQKRVAVLNDVFFLGLFGLLLAAGFGITQGIYQKSVKLAVGAGLGGGLIGCLLGLGAGLAGHYAFILLPERTEWDPLMITIVAQGITLSILGMGVGLAFGIVTPRSYGVLNFLAYGLIGGILAALLFAVGSSLLTPDTGTDLTIPDALAHGRLLWCLLTGLAIGGLVPAARSGTSRRSKRSVATSSGPENDSGS